MKRSLRTLILLSRNDLRSRYAGSALGIVWAYAAPLMTLLIFWWIFECGYRNPPVKQVPYILWFACGYIPWIYFSDACLSGTACLQEYSFLVKKMYFPVWQLPFVRLLSCLKVHSFFIFILILSAIFAGLSPRASWLLLIYSDLSLSALAFSLMQIFALVTVRFRDMLSLINVLLQIGFWASPILWEPEAIPDLRIRYLLKLNPMCYLIGCFRSALLGTEGISVRESVRFWLLTVILFLYGRRLYQRLAPVLADEL
ncbi:MAG: ABC transporter permease [Lachnospiraceae bacterium]|nr:ABC transporter permease [Lachnospiraceae bacterium]